MKAGSPLQSLRSMKRGQRLTVGAVGRCPAALSALIPGKMGAELNVRSVQHSRPRAFARANVSCWVMQWNRRHAKLVIKCRGRVEA